MMRSIILLFRYKAWVRPSEETTRKGGQMRERSANVKVSDQPNDHDIYTCVELYSHSSNRFFLAPLWRPPEIWVHRLYVLLELWAVSDRFPVAGSACLAQLGLND